jgi:hypothetical protein
MRFVDATLGSMTLIGGGILLAGLVGLSLPAGQRSGAAFALVVGAGAGIASVALGWAALGGLHSAGGDDHVNAFFMASIVGFLATVASLAAAWGRARSVAAESPTEDGPDRSSSG